MGGFMKFLALLPLLSFAFQLSTYNHNNKDHRPVEQLLPEAVCDEGADSNPQIFGGKTVNQGSWLAQGTVGIVTDVWDEKENTRKALCTNTLIGKNIMLTAAHYVNKYSIASYTKIIFTTALNCK